MKKIIGKISPVEGGNWLEVSISSNFSVSELQLMWNYFIENGDIPANTSGFLLDLSGFQAEGSSLGFREMNAWWCERFPGKKLAVVSTLSAMVAILSMAKDQQIMPFSSTDGARKWLSSFDVT